MCFREEKRGIPDSPISNHISTLLLSYMYLVSPSLREKWGGRGEKTSPLLGLQHLKLSQIQRCRRLDSDAGFLGR